MGKKKALIFGISGQDGAYLADLLLRKNYNIVGVTRNNKKNNLYRLRKLRIHKKVNIFTNTIINLSLLKKIFKKHININEVYFLSGETSPLKSIQKPIQTIESNVIGIIKILEFIRPKTRNIKETISDQIRIFPSKKKG